MASTGYRSDSTIDRKNFSGIHRASNLRASHVSRTANFDTGWIFITIAFHIYQTIIYGNKNISKCIRMAVFYGI